ncbi:MAG TPA: cytochrome d ubiquinol oxidase subunit II [Actinomycetota bacterium]|nr:cytochrome d ubiquinol oxidase subunit II [Actinomycetota bacterium]
MRTVAAGMLFVVLTAYAMFGGADFGAGFWDLTAGGAERGRRPRALIDHSIGPVWEANHVWLIFCLVLAWTAFPPVFAAVMRTLYVPLGLAALGIVLRGSGFAFRKVSVRTSAQRATGATFAASSVVTPFFFGTAAGAIATGRVPLHRSAGSLEIWFTPTCLFTGALAVVTCAYLAAVFLTAEARQRGEADLEIYFRNRSRLAAAGAGLISAGGLVVLHRAAPHLLHRLLGPGIPFVILSALTGVGVLGLLHKADPRLLRVMAALAVGSVIAGWGVAQYPYLLGNHASIASAAAPMATLETLAGIFVVAAALVLPSLGILYVLHQRGRLESG